MPVTIPDDDPTDKIPGYPVLLHAPPVERSVNEVVEPAHKEDAPDMGKGKGLTDKALVTVQPVPNE